MKLNPENFDGSKNNKIIIHLFFLSAIRRYIFFIWSLSFVVYMYLSVGQEKHISTQLTNLSACRSKNPVLVSGSINIYTMLPFGVWQNGASVKQRQSIWQDSRLNVSSAKITAAPPPPPGPPLWRRAAGNCVVRCPRLWHGWRIERKWLFCSMQFCLICQGFFFFLVLLPPTSCLPSPTSTSLQAQRVEWDTVSPPHSRSFPLHFLF